MAGSLPRVVAGLACAAAVRAQTPTAAPTPPPPSVPDQFNIGAEVCLVVNKPADGVVDLARLRRGIAQVFGVFEGHMHDVRVATEGCHYVFDACTDHRLADFDGRCPPGTHLNYFSKNETLSGSAEATLVSVSDVLTARASILTLSRYHGWPLVQACDDMEEDVCEEYFKGRECNFDSLPRPPGTTDAYFRRGIREQECYACPFSATNTDSNDSYYPAWGVAPRRVRELSSATGLDVLWASIDMDVIQDWTPTTVATYVAWMTPALLSAGFALGWLALHALRPRHDPIAHAVREALNKVERQELAGRWEPRWGWRVATIVWQARLLVVVGFCLLPWLPGQLILLAVHPAALSRGRVCTWMVSEEQRRLRSTLLGSAVASVSFACWILVSSAGGYPSTPKLWRWVDTDGDAVADEALSDLLLDCPVVLGVATPGCFSLLLGLHMASIFFFQGVLCLTAACLLALLLLSGPGLPFLCHRSSLHAMLHPRATPDSSSNRFGGGKLISGQPKEAATGIYGFIGYSEQELRASMAGGVTAIAEEVAALGDEVLSECLGYVLHSAAGASDMTFQHGWLRDRAPDGSELPGRHGMRLADFCALPAAQTAQLTEAHVLALRLYTTAAFQAINRPMRNLKRRSALPGETGDGVPLQPPQLAHPHPLPVTVAFLYEGLKRMRAVSASTQDDVSRTVSCTDPPSTRSIIATIRASFGLAPRSTVEMAAGAAEEDPTDRLGTPARDADRASATGQPVSCSVRSSGAAPSLLSSEAPSGVAVVVGDAEEEEIGLGELRPAGQRRDEHDTSDAPRASASSAPSDAADVRPSASRYLQVRRALVESLPEWNASRSTSKRAPDTILWRGMRDLSTTPAFLARGGTELAPMSTTTDMHIAVQYARAGPGGEALLFRLRSSTFMNLGCDLTPFSAFPHEREALYPPLTYLQPTGKPHRLRYDGCTFTVIEVEPSFPS